MLSTSWYGGSCNATAAETIIQCKIMSDGTNLYLICTHQRETPYTGPAGLLKRRFVSVSTLDPSSLPASPEQEAPAAGLAPHPNRPVRPRLRHSVVLSLPSATPPASGAVRQRRGIHFYKDLVIEMSQGWAGSARQIPAPPPAPMPSPAPAPSQPPAPTSGPAPASRGPERPQPSGAPQAPQPPQQSRREQQAQSQSQSSNPQPSMSGPPAPSPTHPQAPPSGPANPPAPRDPTPGGQTARRHPSPSGRHPQHLRGQHIPGPKTANPLACLASDAGLVTVELWACVELVPETLCLYSHGDIGKGGEVAAPSVCLPLRPAPRPPLCSFCSHSSLLIPIQTIQ